MFWIWLLQPTPYPQHPWSYQLHLWGESKSDLCAGVSVGRRGGGVGETGRRPTPWGFQVAILGLTQVKYQAFFLV